MNTLSDRTVACSTELSARGLDPDPANRSQQPKLILSNASHASINPLDTGHISDQLKKNRHLLQKMNLPPDQRMALT